MTVQRFDVYAQNCGEGWTERDADSDGEYVLYSDYAELEAELERLKAPVSDEEWHPDLYLDAYKEVFNAIIANRAKPQEEAK